jgi:RNA polymerase sigma-70 factor (ECF subfamily)
MRFRGRGLDFLSDDQLLQELDTRRGEEAARRLYRTYARELYGFALHRLRDRPLAEEVVQDVFTRVWRSASAYDASKGSVRTWLYGIARHAVADAERLQMRRPPAALYESEPGEDDEPIERALLRWQVAQAFERLSPEHREVLRLGHFGGMSVREIGDLAGVTPTTVKNRTYYALRNLRLALEELEVAP